MNGLDIALPVMVLIALVSFYGIAEAHRKAHSGWMEAARLWQERDRLRVEQIVGLTHALQILQRELQRLRQPPADSSDNADWWKQQ